MKTYKVGEIVTHKDKGWLMRIMELPIKPYEMYDCKVLKGSTAKYGIHSNTWLTYPNNIKKASQKEIRKAISEAL